MAEDNRDAFANFILGPDAYKKMTKSELQRDMDERYQTGDAYPNPALWIGVHHTELERSMVELIRSKTADADILELGCGAGGIAAHNITDANSIIGTDLSEEALRTAREFFSRHPRLQFRYMDAENIEVADSSFDIVIAKEVLEHLHSPGRCISEVHRVLRRNGLLVLSSPNRDSLHLRLNRKLGRPDFPCAGDHLNEMTYSEMVEILSSGGFLVEASEGVTLMPYHYVEEVFPKSVADLEESDKEFVDWLRILGRRAGPEFAFCYVILARRL
ncbi:MAG: class I SAM-dependent methyltransferase [Alphaproteobacteria bacterium]